MATATRAPLTRFGGANAGEPDLQSVRVEPSTEMLAQQPPDALTDIVGTRLRPPVKMQGTLDRPRLSELIEEVGRRLLTIVKAPAGYGKSSVLGQWYFDLVDQGRAAGWVSLDDSADDLGSFFRHVVGAIRRTRPDFARRLALLLSSTQRASVSRVTTGFCNSVLDTNEDIFLFIDDFHFATDPEVVEAFEIILRRAPEDLHIILSTRHSLPFPISGLRSKGRLIEIDGDQLRFDRGEAFELLSRSGIGHLSSEDLETLLDRTEGWAASIQLAAIAFSRTRDKQRIFSILNGDHRHLTEYLAEDVVNHQPPSTVEFLLRTSILSRLCPELCVAVTGNQAARDEIDVIERQSLFLFSLDGERRWYRYHHLFARFLRRRLQDREPELVPVLHRRASEWFAKRALFEEAFGHALEAGDLDSAARLLDLSCDRLFYKGGMSTLLRWAHKIPASALRHFPRTRLQIAWSIILEWRFEEAAKIIAEVEEGHSGEPAETPVPVGRIDIRSLIAHRKMMLHHFMDNTATADQILSEIGPDFPEDDPYLLGNIQTSSIYTRRETFRLEDVEKMDARARDLYEVSGSIFVLVWHEAVMGPTYYLRGDTELAERSLRAAMRMAETIDGPVSPLFAMPALLLSQILYEKNECKEAEAIIDAVGSEAERRGFVDHLVAYYLTKARLLALHGRVEEAVTFVNWGKRSADRFGFTRLLAWMECEEIRLSVRMNEMDTVKRFLREQDERALDPVLRPGRHTTTRDEAKLLAWSRAKCAAGEHAEAICALRRWASFTDGRGAVASEVRILVSLTLALALDGREGEALRCLREAVKKAARPRMIRCFIDEGGIIEVLLRKCFKGADAVMGPTATFGLEIISLMSRAETDAADGTESRAPGKDHEDRALPEQLNEREGEVLKCVALGLANKEIGDRLGLTEGSVKWYLQQIFAKLDVRKRTMAVARARKFGLI